jgi:hypothetical protein
LSDDVTRTTDVPAADELAAAMAAIRLMLRRRARRDAVPRWARAARPADIALPRAVGWQAAERPW